MKESLSVKRSSFMDDVNLLVCSDVAASPTQTAWRAQPQSRTCVVDGQGRQTGYVHVSMLEEYTLSTGMVTGNTAPNVPSQAGYVSDYQDTDLCALPASSDTLNVRLDNESSQQINMRLDGQFNVGTQFYIDHGQIFNQNFHGAPLQLIITIPDIPNFKYKINGLSTGNITGLDAQGYFQDQCFISNIVGDVNITVNVYADNGDGGGGNPGGGQQQS